MGVTPAAAGLQRAWAADAGAHAFQPASQR